MDPGGRPPEDHNNPPSGDDNNPRDQDAGDESAIQGSKGDEPTASGVDDDHNVQGGGESEAVDQSDGLHGEHQNLGGLSSEGPTKGDDHHPQPPVPVIFEGICLGPDKSKRECKKRLNIDCEVKNQGYDLKQFLQNVFEYFPCGK